ncbi:MAG: hypothetical protein K6C06_07815, partial [Lachnospiraceae bacterium]|nr:hypothetical protein [Lachnospiraceae bacterium]
MRKSLLIVTMALSAAMMLTACGGKSTENVQTPAAATTAAPAAQASTAAASSAPAGGPAADAIEETKPDTAEGVELPEEYEQLFFEGVVSSYAGSVITVDHEGSAMNFDISRYEEDPDYPLVRGCYVEVSYADSPSNDIYPADNVSLLNDNEQLADLEMRDPVIYGKLQVLDINEIEIVDDAGRTVDFDGAIARKVSFAELQKGDDVIITYAGSISTDENDEGVFSGLPFALKVVSADAAKTEDAMANYIDGTVSSVISGGIILSSPINDFECSGDPSVFEGIQEEQKVRVYYTGSISD